MIKEYSIYFDSRKIVITSKFNSTIIGNNTLFVRYNTPAEVVKLLVFFQSSTMVRNLYIATEKLDELFAEFTNHFVVINAAGGLVTNPKDEILLIKRNGLWDLPKGKVDKGETNEDAALREVKEECGINNIQLGSPIIETFHTYMDSESKVLKRTGWFRMRFDGTEKPLPQEDEGITEVCWVSKEKLPEYLCNTYDSIRDVFRKAGMLY